MTNAIVAARVIRVVTGNATATLVHAIDDGGRDQKLELTPAQARTILPGQVLILQMVSPRHSRSYQPPRPRPSPQPPIR